jgi:hypothetical protein
VEPGFFYLLFLVERSRHFSGVMELIEFSKKNPLPYFIILSLVGHLLCGYLVGASGYFEFNAPVPLKPAVNVTLIDPVLPPLDNGKGGVTAQTPVLRPTLPVAGAGESNSDHTGVVARENKVSSSAVTNEYITVAAPLTSASLIAPARLDNPQGALMGTAAEKGELEETGTVSVAFSADYENDKGPVRTVGEFLAPRREKLTYRISLLKVPVGTAVMEATNNGGELRINVRITSNAVLSGFYPVDDLVETRMIKGNYLLTRVRQKEGSYRGDFGFTLMLREHKAFWVDRLANRYNYQPLPCDDVMDLLSGFYFLRSLDLEVGKAVLLHLFDSNEYSPTNVEVLRRERIELSGSGGVDTLVLQPLIKTAGFFRRTGDIMIWLTDDRFRVPVRMESFIALGRVTAELVSAESEQE